MRVLLPLTLVASTAFPLVAQIDHTVVFPQDLAFVEGNTSNSLLLNQPYIRWQQVTSDTLNYPHLVKFMHLRRDGLVPTPAAKNRVVDIEMAMGGSDFASFGTNFNGNWLAGTKTTNLARRTINLPDWSQLPTNAPAPFDLIIPVDTIWAHTGFVYLMFELQVWDTHGAGPGSYEVDAVNATGMTTADVTTLGTGCTTSNGPFVNTSGFTVSQFGSASMLSLSVTGAPSSAAISYLFGVSDPNVTLPNWCGAIRSLPIIGIGVGVSDALGNMSVSFPTGVWDGSGWGAPLYTQAVAIDLGQLPKYPVAVSNGDLLILPALPVDVRSTYSTSPGATSGTAVSAAGLVFEISDT
jgi:hypothetical protein